jgi:hypothetical protein
VTGAAGGGAGRVTGATGADVTGGAAGGAGVGTRGGVSAASPTRATVPVRTGKVDRGVLDGGVGTIASLAASDFAASDFVASDLVVSDLVASAFVASGFVVAGFVVSGFGGSAFSTVIPRRAFSRFSSASMRASCASTSAWLGVLDATLCGEAGPSARSGCSSASPGNAMTIALTAAAHMQEYLTIPRFCSLRHAVRQDKHPASASARPSVYRPTEAGMSAPAGAFYAGCLARRHQRSSGPTEGFG